MTFLEIPEPGTHGCAIWTEPKPNGHGLQLGIEETRREMTRLAKRSAGTVLPIELNASPTRVAEHYRENFEAIRARLEPMLSPGMNVFTHNPWGEYGHEDHVRVFRVLAWLRERIGFRLWMSNYCTERSLTLAMRYFRKAPGGYVRLPADKALVQEIADIYRRNRCWAWPRIGHGSRRSALRRRRAACTEAGRTITSSRSTSSPSMRKRARRACR